MNGDKKPQVHSSYRGFVLGNVIAPSLLATSILLGIGTYALSPYEIGKYNALFDKYGIDMEWKELKDVNIDLVRQTANATLADQPQQQLQAFDKELSGIIEEHGMLNLFLLGAIPTSIATIYQRFRGLPEYKYWQAKKSGVKFKE